MREVTINGKVYKIEYGFNAVCSLEDTTRQSLNDIVQQVSSGSLHSIRLMRAIFWAGLLAHNRGMTLERAGAILDQAGNEFSAVIAEVVGELIDSFVMRIVPAPDKADEAKNAEGTA